MKDVTPARFSLFAAGINKPSSQRPYKQGTLKDVYCWMNSMKMMQNGLLQHSGLLCFDFDHLGGNENLWKARHLLEQDRYFETMLMFTSPRGDGVKWVTHIDLSRGSHEKWYRAVRNYLLQTYGLEADSAPANVASACFLCWDANMVINPSFQLF